jgi:heme-degrading monooxygenase HmoA
VIARVWRGWTAGDGSDASEYETFVTGTVFPDAAAEIPGLVDWEVLRREEDGERVEFVTVAYFESWAAVEAFAGERRERAHVPDRAEVLLEDYEDEVTHYEVCE